MKKISLLIIVMLLSSCGILEFLSAFEPDEGTISEYVDVVYDFNQSGDMVVVALNYDLTPSFNNRDTALDEFNQFYSISIYDTTGKKLQTIFEKNDFSCYNLVFFSDSIIFLGISTDHTNKNNTSILKYNTKTNSIDTLSQDGLVFNNFGRGTKFTISDNMKYVGVTYNSFSNYDDGIYMFDFTRNEIGTILVAPYGTFPNIIWYNDSLFLHYFQKTDSTWSKKLNSFSEKSVKEVVINLSDSIHMEIINEARTKEAKYVQYDKETEVLLIRTQNLKGL